jgi:5-hydroxyisourate hydrolase-like protein (transthyretin family)
MQLKLEWEVQEEYKTVLVEQEEQDILPEVTVQCLIQEPEEEEEVHLLLALHI